MTARDPRPLTPAEEWFASLSVDEMRAAIKRLELVYITLLAERARAIGIPHLGLDQSANGRSCDPFN